MQQEIKATDKIEYNELSLKSSARINITVFEDEF